MSHRLRTTESVSHSGSEADERATSKRQPPKGELVELDELHFNQVFAIEVIDTLRSLDSLETIIQ